RDAGIDVGTRLGQRGAGGVERRPAHLRALRRSPRPHRDVAVDRPRAGRPRDPAHQPRAPAPGQRRHQGAAPRGPRRRAGGARLVKVHLIAACGVGMSALAALLRAAGHVVTGSDEHVYPPASTILADLGIAVAPGYDPARLDGVDLVVCGNAVRRTNPEAEAAEARGLRVMSFPQALAELFLVGRTPIVVAGTHGKTTSAAMLAWLLTRTGRDPGYLVGGLPRDLGASAALGTGPWFVVEGDEYDSAYFDKEAKFLHYRPEFVLLNAIEFDHADIYRDVEHVKGAFRKLLALVPAGAPVVACGDFPHVHDVVRDTRARVLRFGVGEANAWRVADLRDDGMTRFTVREGERAVVDVALPVPGAINARNALGVLLLAAQVGVPWAEGAAALAEFHGVRRRQEVVGEAQRGVAARLMPGVPAIRDYLVESARSGDVIAIMSNGAFGGLPALVAEALGLRPAES